MADPTAAAVRRFEERFAKLFGADTLHRDAKINPYEVIPTGSLALDYKLGVGGWVLGRLHEIWGPEGVGKTSLTLLGIAEAQQMFPNKYTAWIDMEHTFDKSWAEQLGVDLTRLHIHAPKDAEDVADALKEFLTSRIFSMVALDSIGAMIPAKEKEKGADEVTMGMVAKVVTRMVKIAAVEADASQTAVMFVNQVRANLAYGADTTTGGGFALKHATTTKVKVKRTNTPPFTVKVDGVDLRVGHEFAVHVERNKVAPSGGTAVISFFNQATSKYGPVGVDRVNEAATLGITLNFIEHGGAWYTFPDGTRANGKEKVIEHLRQHPDLVQQIREKAIATRAHEVIVTEALDPEVLANGKKGGKKKPNFRGPEAAGE